MASMPPAAPSVQPPRTEDCGPCITAGRKGYCAPGRCYCGHEECHGYESWVDLAAIPAPDATSKRDSRSRNSWANREGATWIDKL